MAVDLMIDRDARQRAWERAASEERDRAWIERELGDVPSGGPYFVHEPGLAAHVVGEAP